MELKALASLTPRERLRLELTDRWGDMADNLDEALAEGNGEKAVRLYWDLVDQAYGKTTQTLDVRAGRREELQAMSDEQLAAELAAIRKRLALEPGDAAELPERAG